jgi:hypothetical protein
VNVSYFPIDEVNPPFNNSDWAESLMDGIPEESYFSVEETERFVNNFGIIDYVEEYY